MAERKDKDYLKQQLYFDPTDEKQAECYEFLRMCNRKTTKYLSAVIHGFLRANNIRLSEMSPELFSDYMKMVVHGDELDGQLPFSGFDTRIRTGADRNKNSEDREEKEKLSEEDREEIKIAFDGF